MFEQAILSHGHETKRVWTTCMGVTTQAMVVTGMILVPMIWPEVLPKGPAMLRLVGPPLPPAPPGEPVVRPRTAQTMAKARLAWLPPALEAPRSVPTAITLIDDLADAGAMPPTAGVIPGLGSEASNGIPGGIPQASGNVAPPPRPPQPVPVKQPSEITSAKPVTIGGHVLAALLRHRVEPAYPALARQARISGIVELQGIIGRDGRIRELKVLRGHPLLVKAALDAVSQWIYEPTRLNGQPVEVDAPITVHFRLN